MKWKTHYETNFWHFWSKQNVYSSLKKLWIYINQLRLQIITILHIQPNYFRRRALIQQTWFYMEFCINIFLLRKKLKTKFKKAIEKAI